MIGTNLQLSTHASNLLDRFLSEEKLCTLRGNRTSNHTTDLPSLIETYYAYPLTYDVFTAPIDVLHFFRFILRIYVELQKNCSG